MNDTLMGLGRISEFDHVVKELGGVKRTASRVKVTRPTIYNWRKAGRFPARYYQLISDALELRGFKPDLKLFAFDDNVAA